ncbi:MAG: NO-inducible flavohemoprotein [Pseudomonadales bacterium]|nr:NO-inducible flavohemoprotein [Pseudomonadales bacterium]
MSLSQHTIDIIKATVPAVAANAEAITAHFYPLMFTEFPQVKVFFNQSHQQSGTQSKALAGAVVAYAANIENLGVLASAVDRIVNKHVSLDIQPAHYEIVGGCLLKSIKAVLGDAATDEVMTAWGEAYWQLANLLIAAEEDKYQASEDKDGGWRGERQFKVARKVAESDVITSFYLEPADGKGVPDFTAGQYLGLVLTIDGEVTRRNYSLSDAPGKTYLRISVKREPGGMVSNYLHDDVNEGDEVSVLPPAGEFVVKDNDKPLVLVTGGVGITPAISMLNQAAASGRKIDFIHAAINSQTHAFREHVSNMAVEFDNVNVCNVYNQPTEVCKPDATGYINLALLEQCLGDNRDVEFYFLGPKPFMVAMNQTAHDLGIHADNIHFEFFGPLEDLQLKSSETIAA